MDPFLDDGQQANAPAFDLGGLWRSFWRRKLLFIVPFVLCLAMALVAIKTMTPMYASRGQIWIQTDYTRSQLLIDPAQAYGRSRDPSREIRAELETILTSPHFLQAVVRELGLDKTVKAGIEAGGGGPVDDSQAVLIAEARLRRMIRLENSGSYLYDIEVRDTDPQRAFDLAKYIVARFVDEYRTARLASRATTREFLETQKGQAETDLAAAEKELSDFIAAMAATDVVDSRINGGNLSMVEEKLGRVQARHEGADATEFNELAAVARRILGKDPPAAVYAGDAVVKSLEGELEDLGVDLLTTDESDRDYQDLETRLGRLRVQLNNRIAEMVANLHPDIGLMDRNRLAQYYYSYVYRSVELQVLRRVQRSAQDYRRVQGQRPLQTSRLDELQEKVKTARDLVATLDREITQQRMSFEAGMSDVGFTISIRRQPFYWGQPVEPDVTKLTFMAFLLSLGMGTGLVVLAILLDRSFKSVVEIENTLGIKVIGTLPLVQDDHFERRRRRRVMRWIAVILAVLAVAAVGFLVVYPKLNM
ncbi:MAG TPA: Wzz/FepE/Etk N-terminal domain-containing protein [Candidatus Krumholzibacteria bacterium]|nr:Wzz/FepE/Etk N-terminal domain-containing protein [Candidatus Krumholzibacteria bacterium]